MKKSVLRSTAVLLIILIAVSISTISVSHAVSFTNSKGTVKVVCGSYSKKFKPKKYGKNFCRALNAALDTARKKATDKKKAVVTVPKGNYSLDRTIKIYSNTTLKAEGCYFRYYGNLLRNGYNGKASAASEYNGARNITIDGGTWDAAVPYSQAGTANWRIQHSTIRFAHAENITIQNCVFRNNYNCHDIELGGVDGCEITASNFINDKAVNTFKNDGGREAIQLDVNDAAAMPEFASFDYTPCKNITVSGCNFLNKFRAVGSHHAALGKPFDNIQIHDNYLRNIGGISVYAVYWTNSKIYGNRMEYVGLGVDARSMTIGEGYNFMNPDKLSADECNSKIADSKLYIYDNEITLRKKNNTYVRSTGIRAMGEHYEKAEKKTGVLPGTYYIYGVNVGVDEKGNSKPNTIKGNVAVGIQMNYAVNSLVKNNSVNAGGSVSSTSNGIEVKGCENTTVSNNTVKNGTVDKGRGIYLTPTAAGIADKNVVIESNKINNFKMSGIYAYKAADSEIKKNTVDTTQDMGVSVRTCENLSLTDNKIKNTVNAGAYIYSGSLNTKFEENSVSTTNKTGIKLNKADSTKLRNNSVADTGDCGVLVRESGKTELIENNISKTVSYGVRVNYGSDNTEIYNNSISSLDKECIYFNGANDMTPNTEKSLTVAENYLDTAESAAAVSVSNSNVAARIYSNYRTDGKDIVYRFKGDEDSKYKKVTAPLSVKQLSVEKCEGYNILNWSAEDTAASYRVYREDETGTNLITDTPEQFCLDNNVYKKAELETTADNNSDSDKTIMEKLKILSYSVSAYRSFSNVKYFGEPVSVDFESYDKVN